jgi:hypothetical protein
MLVVRSLIRPCFLFSTGMGVRLGAPTVQPGESLLGCSSALRRGSGGLGLVLRPLITVLDRVCQLRALTNTTMFVQHEFTCTCLQQSRYCHFCTNLDMAASWVLQLHWWSGELGASLSSSQLSWKERSSFFQYVQNVSKPAFGCQLSTSTRQGHNRSAR